MKLSAILFQIQSIIIVGLLIWGIRNSKNRKKHIQLMSYAIAWDILLILQIELNRHAVEKAVTLDDNSHWLNIHVSLAVATVIFYFIMIALGRKVLSGKTNLIPLHRKFGYFTFLLRILTLITSFVAVS